MKKSTHHYVDNKQLFVVMQEFKSACNEAEETGDDFPRIPDYVGRCLLKIAQRLSTKPNFINYTFREEMISDGIENCIHYIKNFDPNKSKNPFAYFTQIIYYAFLRRIQKEKKQLYIKHKSLEQSIIFDSLVTTMDGDNRGVHIDLLLSNNTSDYMKGFVESFESKEKKRREKKPVGVEKFYTKSE